MPAHKPRRGAPYTSTLVVMPSSIALRVSKVPNPRAAVQPLRRILTTPVAVLAKAVQDSQLIELPDLFARTHDEDEKKLLALLSDLEAMGVSFDLEIDGRLETKQFLFNILEQWRDIQYDTDMEME